MLRTCDIYRKGQKNKEGNSGPFEMQRDDSDQWKLCYGGGIGYIQSNAIITQNIIKDNSTYAGGVVMVYLGVPKDHHQFNI